jgi:hypothetical protein
MGRANRRPDPTAPDDVPDGGDTMLASDLADDVVIGVHTHERNHTAAAISATAACAARRRGER